MASEAGQESFERIEAALRGAIDSSETTAVGQRIVVRTAETALIQGTREIERWHRTGRLNSKGAPLPHRRLWAKIQSLTAARAIAWHAPMSATACA